MKKLLKIIVPPFVGFGMYFLAVRYSPLYFSLQIGEIGGGNMVGFMAFYRYSLPLLFTISVLTQLLIVIPIWDYVRVKSYKGKIWATVFLLFVCLLFAAGISYAIWDHVQGTKQLLNLFGFMTAVQLVYWLIDLFVLYLIDRRKPQLP